MPNALLRILFGRSARRTSGAGVHLQRASAGAVGGHGRARTGRTEESALTVAGGMLPPIRGHAIGGDLEPDAADQRQVTGRGYDHRSRYTADKVAAGYFAAVRAADVPISTSAAAAAQPAYGEPEGAGSEEHRSDLGWSQGSEVDPVPGRRRPRARPGLRPAGGNVHRLPGLGDPRLNEEARRRRSRASASPTRARCRWRPRRMGQRSRQPSGAPLLATLRQTLDSFVEMRLSYLSLDRSSAHAVGRRDGAPMIRHFGSSLTDVTYVFDSRPSACTRVTSRRWTTCSTAARQRRHRAGRQRHPEAIAIADHVVDPGPGAGADGGEVVFGARRGLRASRTLTRRHLGDQHR